MNGDNDSISACFYEYSRKFSNNYQGMFYNIGTQYGLYYNQGQFMLCLGTRASATT